MASSGKKQTDPARSRPPVLALFVAAAACVVGCGKGPAVAPIAARDEARPFVFDSLDERPVSSEAFRGKPAVLLFLTTWDVASQAEVGIVSRMAQRDGGEVRYAIVALHEKHERELVENYARALKVTFPVALGDSESRVGRGPLGDVHAIPTVLVLDARGRIVQKHVGITKADVLRPSIEAAKRDAP
jgi:hypothetical protein